MKSNDKIKTPPSFKCRLGLSVIKINLLKPKRLALRKGVEQASREKLRVKN